MLILKTQLRTVIWIPMEHRFLDAVGNPQLFGDLVSAREQAMLISAQSARDRKQGSVFRSLVSNSSAKELFVYFFTPELLLHCGENAEFNIAERETDAWVDPVEFNITQSSAVCLCGNIDLSFHKT